MSRHTFRISLASVAAALSILVYGAAGSGAAAQVAPVQAKAEPTDLIAPVASSTAAAPANATVGATPDQATSDAAPATLADLAARQDTTEELPQQLQCLASAIYFEAGHEKLAGQLAVGRVIVERSRSGRFPDSYCGVVYQRAQFSFIHGNAMPAIKTGSAAWHNAVAMARVAHEGSWQSPAEGALFFHSVRISPKWSNRVRVARIDNHIFYR